jgi:hypothetical protein
VQRVGAGGECLVQDAILTEPVDGDADAAQLTLK